MMHLNANGSLLYVVVKQFVDNFIFIIKIGLVIDELIFFFFFFFFLFLVLSTLVPGDYDSGITIYRRLRLETSTANIPHHQQC